MALPNGDMAKPGPAFITRTKKLQNLPRSEVEDVIQSIPPEWQVGDKAKTALADLLTRRAAYVAERIMDWIWPQSEFEFLNEAEDES